MKGEKKPKPIITGTFLDEITHDIPSQNWGEEDWLKEFKVMKEIGIDTVIIIRAGYKNFATFDSRVIDAYVVPDLDLAELFLRAAELNDMKLFFGLYDSGNYWMKGDWQKETEVNKGFIDEVYDKYGYFSSFHGWYLPHEVSLGERNYTKLIQSIGGYCKEITPEKPTLISPFFRGVKVGGSKPITVNEHKKVWESIFENIAGYVDICAFQDGHVEYEELEEWFSATKELTDRFGITLWSNCESFDRDMPIKFMPIDWRKMRVKLQVAYKFVEKIITFEFPHFMSPNSIWPSARNLYARYKEYLRNFILKSVV